MSNRAAIQAAMEDWTGIRGTDYDNRYHRAINWAIAEICMVKFGILFVEGSDISVTSGVKQYDLPSDFNYAFKFYIDGIELIEGTEEDLIFGLDTGQPNYYCVSGSNGAVRTVMIGAPTADSSYTVDFGYYKTLPSLTSDTDESAISTLYRDDPIISAAVGKFYTYIEKFQESMSVSQQFQYDMKRMEAVIPYVGKSYSEILQEKGIEKKDDE